MKTKEIVTIQIGKVANHVGTHLWNAQESLFNNCINGVASEDVVDHDCLYQSGQSIGGEPTFFPRCVIIDSSANMMDSGDLLIQSSSSCSSDLSWDNSKTETHEKIRKHHLTEEEIQKNGSAMSWTDFCWTSFSPKSLVSIKEPLNWNFEGSSLFRSLEDELVEEKLRYFIEQCDYLQGFNVLCDTCTGFGGLSSSLLDTLADEYPRKTRLAFGFEDFEVGGAENAQDSVNRQAANMSLALCSLQKSSSALVPVRMPSQIEAFFGLEADCSSLWQSSGLLAAAIDSILLPARFKGPQVASLSELTGHVDAPVNIIQLWQQFGSTMLPQKLVSGKPIKDSWDYMCNSFYQNVPVSGAVAVSRGNNSASLENFLSKLASTSYRDFRGTLAIQTPLSLPQSPMMPHFGRISSPVDLVAGFVHQPSRVVEKAHILANQLLSCNLPTKLILEQNGIGRDELNAIKDWSSSLVELLSV